MTVLPPPVAGSVPAWVSEHVGDVCSDDPRRSGRFRGTQLAADAALAAFDVTGYGGARNEVWPTARRGATGLSPWIRHGLLQLPRVWAAAEGPSRDVRKFRDELRWQEYARHLYARLGGRTASPLRAAPPEHASGVADPWDRTMACVDLAVEELERDGWLVNQTRMWLASQWTVRHGWSWRRGEDRFYTHLLDGSRAANRLGWQWTVGAATGRAYGFSQRQVRKRAPGLCGTCVHERACPIAGWPDDAPAERIEPHPLLRRDLDIDATAGPLTPLRSGDPEAVWLTAESLGDDDPALLAHPELPVVFVFDVPLLARLGLSGKRLVFLTERLAELAIERDLTVHRGAPTEVLADIPLAATFSPVPGWRRYARALDVVVRHPWPWLERPDAGSLTSFTAWAKRRRPRPWSDDPSGAA